MAYTWQTQAEAELSGSEGSWGRCQLNGVGVTSGRTYESPVDTTREQGIDTRWQIATGH